MKLEKAHFGALFFVEFLDIDHFLTVIGQVHKFIGQLRRLIVHFSTVIGHFHKVIVISGLMNHQSTRQNSTEKGLKFRITSIVKGKGKSDEYTK
ncbi:hypothetical protein [Sporosarcina koreensis]|uniref:Uncharacterized protein n=1 Tax=Sporosarcina koreensis TaxID=334735 RepID=A0ABW0U3A6_9BACL